MPGGSKAGGGLEVKSKYKSGFKMKYQGNTSTFPFKDTKKPIGKHGYSTIELIKERD